MTTLRSVNQTCFPRRSRITSITPGSHTITTPQQSIREHSSRNGGARLHKIVDHALTLTQQIHEAARVESHALPKAPSPRMGFDIAGKTCPWGIVSGDYFDFLPFDHEGFAILVGDVAGKGVPAALLMSGLRGHARSLFVRSGALSRKMVKLNRAICRACPPDRFITLFVATVDPSGALVYVNAGHNPPLVVRSSGDVEALTAGGVVLGVEPAEKYQEGRVKLEVGDTLVLFSDGVTEASDAAGEPFGEARLAKLMADVGDLPAHGIVDAVHDEVAAFTQGASPADDITVVVAKRVGCRRKRQR